MRTGFQRAIFALGLLGMTLAPAARAQLQVGDNVNMNLSGNIAFGYSGDYSNLAGSDHSISPAGNADLRGSYYSPSFLSFEVQPFYSQSRVNSNYQSSFRATGVNSSASIFSGSHFPGSVNFVKTYNSSGQFSVPGVGDLTTHANSQNLALGWGIRIPDYPNVSFQFADGSTDSTIFGSNAKDSFHTRHFGVSANHTLAGFVMNAGYHRSSVNSTTPDVFTGAEALNTDTSSNTYDFGVSHKLPFHGAFSASASKADVNTSTSGERYDTTIDTVGSGVNFIPVKNLNVGVTAQYTDNLQGSIYEGVIVAGGVVPASLLNYSTHSLDINSLTSYVIPKAHLTFTASVDRRDQTILGGSVTSDTLEELVNYANDFLGGFFNVTVGLSQTSVDFATHSSSNGYLGNVSYTRKYQKWNVNGALNYSHNTQTLLIGYTSSGHGYSLGLGRKVGTQSYWSLNASGTKSNFSGTTASDNFAQSYGASLSMRRMSVSGSYAKAHGTSFLTPNGLTPISNPAPGLLESIVFNGKSYSFGASTTPIYGLVLSGTYSKTDSDTLATAATSRNSTQQLNTMLQYKVRKLWITAGYLKLRQGFSITDQPTSSESSFFIGITRWFNLF